MCAVLVMTPSAYLYLHAGVVRNVPELDVVKGKEHRGMFGEYCDRVYQYKDFPKEDNSKINVLVEGYSFGRDFANVLLESQYADSINLCYTFLLEDEGVDALVRQADYVFTYRGKQDVPQFVWQNAKNTDSIFGIGTKNYGSCNGIIYARRNADNYFDLTAKLSAGYENLNADWKQQWGDKYIDLLSLAMVDDTHVQVFTDDNRYISQDCRHLTQGGAQWYARMIDWSKIFN